MAKKLTKTLKLQVTGGKATAAPPLGPVLGQAQVNIAEFIKQFNEATKDQMGKTVSILLNCYDDRSFDFVIKTPPVSSLILEAAGIEKGSGKNASKKAGSITRDQLRKIAETKLPDLNCTTVEAAMKIVEGSCRSAGITVK